MRLLFLLFCLIATPVFAQVAQPVQKPATPTFKASDLAKAHGLSEVATQADSAASAVTAATRIGIIVEGAQKGQQGQIVIMPTDAEWAAVTAAVASVAARRKSDATAALSGMGMNVTLGQ